MSQLTDNKRNVRLDSVKGFLMILVVVGHCLPLTSHEGFMRLLFNAIYSFHMPLFVFLTGYFTNLEKDCGAYLKGILNLFCTYLLFQIVYMSLFLPTFDFTRFFYPGQKLWFLLSVIWWRLFFYGLKKLDYEKLLILSAVLSVAGGFIPVGTFLSIQRTLYFGVFFVLGLYIKHKKLLPCIYSIPAKFVILLSALLLSAILLILKDNHISWILYGRADYKTWPVALHICPLLRFALLFLSCAGSLLFIKFCPTVNFLASLGQNTLFIYIYHSLIYCVLRHVRLGNNDFVILAAALAIIFGLLFLLNKIPFFHYLLEPYKYISRLVMRSKTNTMS